jgi:predicted NUDIX family NTP pyrophosphohydrolase
MPKKSAGILLFRKKGGHLEVFLVHPGGPFFVKKDLAAWSIPKGEVNDDEDPLAAAKREFLEETAVAIDGEFVALNPIRQKSGKVVLAWAVEGEIDETSIRSNSFAMEWPPRSGRFQEFPEIDKGAWFSIPEARQKIIVAQAGFLDELVEKLGV